MPILSRKLLLFLLIAGVAFANVTIYLKKESILNNSPTLSQVASIEGDAKLAAYLASLPIDKAALEDGVLTPKEVLALLKSHYIDTSKIRIVGKGVRFFHKGSVLTKAELERMVQEYVKRHYKDMVIESVSIGVKKVQIPSRKYSITIKERSRTFRHLYLNLTLTSPSTPIRTIPVTVKVSEYIAAPFAKRDIPKGKVITPEDVEIRKVKRYNSLQKRFDPSQLYGSVAKRTIHQGQRIRPSAYEPDYLVKKRSSVKIFYDRGGIRIELLGLALENGQKGDIIRVKNLSSNKVLRCKVISAGSVLFVR